MTLQCCAILPRTAKLLPSKFEALSSHAMFPPSEHIILIINGFPVFPCKLLFVHSAEKRRRSLSTYRTE